MDGNVQVAVVGAKQCFKSSGEVAQASSPRQRGQGGRGKPVSSFQWRLKQGSFPGKKQWSLN